MPDPQPDYDLATARSVFVDGQLNDDGDREWKSEQWIADLFEIPLPVMLAASRAEDWPRDQAAAKAANRRRLDAKRAEDKLKAKREADDRAEAIAKMGTQAVQLRLGAILTAAGEHRKKVAALKRGENEVDGKEFDSFDVLVDPIDARELGTLSAAMEGWQRVTAKALGEVETLRLEVSGEGGGPVQSHVTVTSQLQDDDDGDRTAKLLRGMENAGLLPPGVMALLAGPAPQEEDAGQGYAGDAPVHGEVLSRQDGPWQPGEAGPRWTE